VPAAKHGDGTSRRPDDHAEIDPVQWQPAQVDAGGIVVDEGASGDDGVAVTVAVVSGDAGDPDLAWFRGGMAWASRNSSL
jgi:hypothetical protein